MPTNKKIFLITSVLFTLLMVGFTIDFFSRTTLPGRKGQLQHRIENRLRSDSIPNDSTGK